MGRLPPRALASQRTLLLGGLLLPLALSSALREEVTKNVQAQNTKCSPLDDICTTTESITPESVDQNTTQRPNATTPLPVLTCSAECPRNPPVTTCPSPCPACRACPSLTCPTCPAYPACPAIASCKKAIPPGYEHFPGVGYYRLHTFPLDWVAAKATCEREGSHLAIINSQEEANVMTNLFKRDLKIGLIILLGFHDMYEEGKYVTVFGHPLETTRYTKWDIRQPDNLGGNENCGSMYPSGGLNDITCDSIWPFVCELPV